MLVDGRAIAAEILAEVAAQVAARHDLISKESSDDYGNGSTPVVKRAPQLVAITCAPKFETRKYLKMKKAKAASVGIALRVVELSEGATTEAVIASIEEEAAQSDGIVVQLPMPAQIDREAVLAAVPVDKDPDGFQYGKAPGACFPPVVGAIDAISQRHQVDWSGKRVVVLGEGRLVGKPAAAYAQEKGGEVTILNKETYDPAELKTADIIISGIGQPHFITADLLAPGVVIFDAGTSEEGGVLVGDADPAVESVASLLTPVPGGIGPITIAYLLRNLVWLVSKDR